MEQNNCPKTPSCPIFNGILKGTVYTEIYQKQYCLAGEEGRNRCRRFQVATVIGRCPANVLPNSSKSVDEIVEDMKRKSE